MADVSTVRGLIPELKAQGMDVLLLNIHTQPGSALLDRFDFAFSPTYLVYDAKGSETLRGNALPDTSTIISASGLASAG